MKPKTELSRLIEQLTEFILDVAPDARVELEQHIYEDEDANISVFPPLDWDDDQCLDLQETITGRAVEVHLETGYMIAVYVFMPEQQVAEAESRRKRALKEVEAADRILAEAAALGLTNGQPQQSDPVPA